MAAFVSKSSVWIRSIYSSFFSHCKQRGLKEKNDSFWHVHRQDGSNGSFREWRCRHKTEVTLTERSRVVFSYNPEIIWVHTNIYHLHQTNVSVLLATEEMKT